jgi:hypothetical protein
MADETRITVKVDTGQAEAGEREMERAKGRAQRKRNTKIASSRGRIARGVSFGAGAVVGNRLSARLASRFTKTTAVDMGFEASTVMIAKAQQEIDESLGVSVRATKAARADTRQAFRDTMTTLGTPPPGMANLNDFFLSDRALEEKGRNILYADQRFSIHPGGVAATAAGGYVKLMFMALESLLYGEQFK